MSTIVFVMAFCGVAVFVYMARYSGRLRVEQVRLIAAPLGAVYAQVIDLGHWPAWSPWLDADAGPQLGHTGPADQVGGRLSWDSPRLSCGTVEHLRTAARRQIEQRMRVRQPLPFRGRCVWRFAEVDGKTRVSCSLKGRVGFAMRAFAPTVQGAIALDFRHGLDRLAGLLEPAGMPRYAINHLGVREVAATRYASLRHEGPIDALGDAVPARMAELRQQLAQRQVPTCGDPIAVYASTDIRRRTAVCHIGIPVGTAAITDLAGLPTRELAAHRAYVVRLEGSRAGLEVAWYGAMQRLRAEGIQPDPSRPPFERCVGLLTALGGSGLVTELHLPIR